jgi:hypothetical protein
MHHLMAEAVIEEGPSIGQASLCRIEECDFGLDGAVI